MSDAKDLAIKLFGKTISLPDIPDVSRDSAGAPEYTSGDILDGCIDRNLASSVSNSSLDSNTFGDGEEKEQEETDKDTFGGKPLEDRREDGGPTQSTEVFTDPNAASRTHEDSITTSIEKEATTLKTSKTEEQSETCNSQEKTLKKPDKILPCPRCSSMETKFCYYNNYNVNQPRHFCKNCQRYWTAGGTMRNMPVGAGRRKSKYSTSHYRQITVSEALQNAPADVTYGVHHPSLKSNGPETPLIESMAFVLNLADKTTHNCTINGFHRPQNIGIPFPYASEEKGNDHLNNFSATSTELMEDARVSKSQEQVMQNCQSFPPQIPSFSGPPWPSPWNLVPWSSAPPPPPVFCPPGFTVPFNPAAAYWGCTVSGAWTIPWLVQPSSPKSVDPNNGPDSPTLGKHSREGNMLKSNDSRGEYGHNKENHKCLQVPKTSRIDEPREAARSSIWTTLGIKSDEVPSVHKGGLFKAFPSKNNGKNHPMQTSPFLLANPAALSRSFNFHETS